MKHKEILKGKGKDIPCNHKMTGVALLKSDKLEFSQNTLVEIKRNILQLGQGQFYRNITLNLYDPNNKAPIYRKQKQNEKE